MRQILSPLRRGGIKAGILILAILLSGIAVAQSSKKAVKASALEVSFNYQRQAGPGSNQYAVWIENEKGEFVKTLFVTSYTAKGRSRGAEPAKRGYIVRPACVPVWVKDSKAEEKTDMQLDAVTGATPQAGGVQTFTWDFTDEQGKAVPQAGGVQTFTWDFTDEQGKAVPQGIYKVKVEATLIFDSDIVYTGTFSTKDKPGNITLTSELTKPDEQHKNMVTDVKAVLK